MSAIEGVAEVSGQTNSEEVTPPLSLQELKAHYRTGVDDLATAFFAPCLKEARVYRRAAGYFSSMALLTWMDSLPRLVLGEELRVELIASPELSALDLKTLRELEGEEKLTEYREALVDRMLDEVLALSESPDDSGIRVRIFAWLVANGRLEIRFAFAAHVEQPGLFHQKIGVFDFSGGSRVAFNGSANETLGGHRRNYESIDVYRSWVASDVDRVETKVGEFHEMWENEAVGLDVETMSAKTLARLREKAPLNLPRSSRHAPSTDGDENYRWRHQEEAVEAFLLKRAGILEMATGTGKTRTTLKILQSLIDSNELKSAIIATDGTDLLDQWATELDAWTLESTKSWLVFRHYERHKEIGEFALHPEFGVLVVSRPQLAKVISLMPESEMRHMMIVHDEVHGLGVPSLINTLTGRHQFFGWRLGLSATPERSYDEEGNTFIRNELGETIYKFSLEDAISRGVLCEFDYVPLTYELTAGDRRRIGSVYARRAARSKAGEPMKDEEFWNEIAKVYKTAEMKPMVFSEYLVNHPEFLHACIIFVETKEYGNGLLENLHEYTTKYRTYYAEDDRIHLEQFAQNEIDCLITCHRISQGIDLRSLLSVVLFASARSKLETIQRIGRCLRVDPDSPDKRAIVVDFVRHVNDDESDSEFPSADDERCDWLKSMSKVRRMKDA